MGRDHNAYRVFDGNLRFQSTLPAWGETGGSGRGIQWVTFQSTLPAWGETAAGALERLRVPFQSTLPAWGETVPRLGSRGGGAISIHSPRMGRDVSIRATRCDCFDFNPLSPHGERPGSPADASASSYFNPLSPHGERPHILAGCSSAPAISIHSPRMGRDGAAGP